jgi:glycosyltransferase involved in cell wall biosynthesis
MKKSVLFLTNAYPDFESSYRGIFIKKMALLLEKEGFQLTIITPKIYRGSPYFEEQNGIKVYRFPFFARDKLLIEHKKIPYLRMILYYLTGFFLTVYAMLKNKCDVIHAHWAIPTGLIGVWVGFLLKKPLIVTIHGSDLRMALERPGFLRKIFVYVCKNATHLNCVSEVQRKELERLDIPSEKILTIPMGIDEAFLETGKHRKAEFEKRPITILSNRNLLPIYNVSLLIRAIPIVMKEEPETKFLIAGDGAEKEALERKVKNLNINSSVKFLGRVPHEEMPALLSHADIYVSTSLYDGTSVSLLEAMGSGAFPIVTDIPANREWISDGENGFLVQLDEERFLAEKIVKAIRNQDLMERSRDRNFSLIKEKALWPVTIENIKSIYAEILAPEVRNSRL